MGATDEHENITPLGRIMSLVALHPLNTKALLLGIVFRCLGPMLFTATTSNWDDALIASGTAPRSEVDASKREFAGETESDLLGLYRAFTLYDEAVANKDEETKQRLRRKHFIQVPVYQDLVQEARSAWDRLVEARILPERGQHDSPFRAIPPALNTNANNSALIKALALQTTAMNLAARRFEGQMDWTARGARKVLMHPRSVNHRQSKPSPTALRAARRPRAPGDICSYAMKRENIENKYPWIHETSMITPLTAILFRDAQPDPKNKILVDEWLRLWPEVKRHRPLGLTSKQIAQLLLEMRKGIDRFTTFAFSDVYDLDPGNRNKPSRDRAEYNKMLVGDNELRDAFVDGVVKILNADSVALEEELERRKYIIEEMIETKKEEEAVRKSKDESDRQ